MEPKLLAVVGPTATGKSALALRLAKRFGGEIVNADSRQIYRHMDIGTAKPSPRELAEVPHHLIDILNPDHEFSLVLFLRLAKEAIQGVHASGRLPILVGGTGQYVWALVEGWQVPEVRPDPDLRATLEERAQQLGHKELHDELSEINPEAAERIDPKNVRRVIRALEVFYTSRSQPPTADRNKPPFDVKMFGLNMDRPALYRRIDDRVDLMIKSGWIDEVLGLLNRGYSTALPALSSLGYDELVRHVKGELSLEEAVERTKNRTHRFARRQHTWFRSDDSRIRWFDAESDMDEAEEEVARWLEEPAPSKSP